MFIETVVGDYDVRAEIGRTENWQIKYAYSYVVKYRYNKANNIEPWNNYNNSTIFTFTSSYNNSSFLQALIDYVTPFIEYKTEKDKINKIQSHSHIRRFSKYYDNIKIIDEYFEKDEDFTKDDVTRLLIDLLERSDVDTENLLQLHNTRFKDGVQSGDGKYDYYVSEQYLSPGYADLTFNEFFNLYSTYNIRTSLSKDKLKAYNTLCLVLSDDKVDDNMLVKDYVIHDDYIVIGSRLIIEWPIFKEQFQEYLFNLTIKDLRKLYKNANQTIKKTTSATQALKIAEDIIANSDDEILRLGTADIADGYAAVLKNCTDLSKKSDLYIMHEFLLNSIGTEDDFIVKILCEYFTTVENLNNDDLTNVVQNFVNARSKWISKKAMANLVLTKLYKISDAVTIVETINDIVVNDKAFSPTQWNKIIDDWDSYKDIPVSLWRTLL